MSILFKIILTIGCIYFILQSIIFNVFMVKAFVFMQHGTFSISGKPLEVSMQVEVGEFLIGLAMSVVFAICIVLTAYIQWKKSQEETNAFIENVEMSMGDIVIENVDTNNNNNNKKDNKKNLIF